MSSTVPKQAVILVGGRGTRLGPLTERTPKPLLHVGGRPFIEYLIENLRRFGITRVTLLCGYMSDEITAWKARWADPRTDIEVIVEPSAAGTAGALLHCADHLDDIFVLANGDSLFDINLTAFAAAAPADDWIGYLALRMMEPDARYGRVVVDDTMRVLTFDSAKPNAGGAINGGVYILRRAILDWIDRTPLSIEHEVFPALAESGLLRGSVCDGFFLDIGIPTDFERAHTLVPAQCRRPAVFLDRDGVLNVDRGYVHRPEDLTWIQGAQEAVRLLNDLGYFVFVVTNQAGVAHGYYAEEAIHTLHDWMQAELARVGAHVDQFEYCPFHPEGKVERYRQSSYRRKPEPGMLNHCFETHDIVREKSFLIGDKASDLEAARAAGVQGYLFQGGDLSAFVREILSHHETPGG